MDLEKISPQILHFKCSNRKELTFTFGRVQEFYEGPNPKIRGQRFSLYDFLNAYTKEDGELTYFQTWSGFNFPGHVFREWVKLHKDFTPPERAMVEAIKSSVTTKKFYVIGTYGESGALDHEIAHALFYLDPGYAARAISIIEDFLKPSIFNKMCDFLQKSGYDESVFVDEINAYLATSSAAYMRKRLKMDAKRADPARRMLGHLFSKYRSKLQP